MLILKIIGIWSAASFAASILWVLILGPRLREMNQQEAADEQPERLGAIAPLRVINTTHTGGNAA